jgi:hypothetical protein
MAETGKPAGDSATIGADVSRLLSGPADFCADWPKVKQALKLIASYVKTFKPEVAKMLGEVITWGDRAYEMCDPTPIPPPLP